MVVQINPLKTHQRRMCEKPFQVVEDVPHHRVAHFLIVSLTENLQRPNLDLNRHLPLLIILPAIILPELGAPLAAIQVRCRG